MKSKITEHLLSIILVSIFMVGVLIISGNRVETLKKQRQSRISYLLDAPVVKVNDPFERALLTDCLDIFYPGQHDSNVTIVEQIFSVKEDEFNQSMQSSYRSRKLTPTVIFEIFLMFIKFLVIYIIVMLLTYYGVQTLGVLRFIQKQHELQKKAFLPPGTSPIPPFSAVLRGAGKTVAYFILFSPAYVIAYSIRTEFNTDSSLFMILLGVISNGLLVMYTNKFFAFLVAENKKGYVENALVKNLHSGYTIGGRRGFSWGAIFTPRKKFDGHVLDHIFRNARFQYLSTIKEQASFLITGLVIIEMALNIHGHLTYELLRQLLYKNYPIVITIMLFIFLTVKLTELFTDLLVHREAKRYENH